MSDEVCEVCGAGPVVPVDDLAHRYCNRCLGEYFEAREQRLRRERRCVICEADSPIAHPSAFDLYGGPFCEACAIDLTREIEREAYG